MEAKCVLVYASITGNTKEMADKITEGVIQAGWDLDIQEMWEAHAAVLEKYDSILVGSSTWGGGELPDEALDFYEEMDQLNLNGKMAAVFGSGDQCYPWFGAAVDILEQKLRNLGAHIVLDKLKVELSPSKEELELCRNFGKAFVQQVSQRPSQIPH